MRSQTLSFAAFVAAVAAQRPSSTPICDYYTTALFGNNTGANQYALVAAAVNRAVIGNKTSTPVVNGIVVPGTFNGSAVDLSVYFTGAQNSTNRGGSSGVSVNFLDDGGAAPLLMGKPANGTSSNQYKLLTHLYEYFGALLGCSQYGMTGYPAYAGSGSQYEVHKFMDLDEYDVGYFIAAVGASAASFGVTDDDVKAIGTALTGIFDVRCGPNTTVIPAQGAQLQSICIESTCQLAANSSCAAYATPLKPTNVTSGGTSSSGSSSSMTSGTASMTSGSPSSSSATAKATNAAVPMVVSGVLGAAALALAL